jgi:hypothetical protein
MKIRTLCLACVTTAAVLFAGCTAVYKNTDACEQMMRTKLAGVTPEQVPDAAIDKLSIDHTGTGIHGTRVVVEGSLAHLQTASEVAAAAAPKGASAAVAASAAAPATTVAAASGASAPAAASAKPVKPKKVSTATAAECTFNGLSLASFRWLAPAELVKTNDAAAASDSAE